MTFSQFSDNPLDIFCIFHRSARFRQLSSDESEGELCRSFCRRADGVPLGVQESFEQNLISGEKILLEICSVSSSFVAKVNPT